MGEGTRQRKRDAKRARIAEAALELFERQGYAETTIDQIAAAAAVGRRTVFNHYPSKEAILFDRLLAGRERILTGLAGRPLDEPPLVSLHDVLRQRAADGLERALLNQVRAVVAADPGLLQPGQTFGGMVFEHQMVAALRDRPGAGHSEAELKALVAMACSWFVTATHLYFVEAERSLLSYFDQVVALCVDGGLASLAS